MKVLIAVLGLLISTAALADVYKCVLPNGEIQYIDHPCQAGVQKAFDTDAKNSELRKEQEKERKRLEPIIKEQKIKQALVLEKEKKEAREKWEKETKEAREKFVLIDIEKIKTLVDCQKSGCSPSEYRYLLIGRPPGMVEDVLNCRTQEFGTQRIRHCAVMLMDAGHRRSGKVQLMTGNVSGLPDGVISYDRINEVNVF